MLAVGMQNFVKPVLNRQYSCDFKNSSQDTSYLPAKQVPVFSGFYGDKRKNKTLAGYIGAAILALTSIAGTTAVINKEVKADIKPEEKIAAKRKVEIDLFPVKPAPEEIGWNNNVRVLASCGEDHQSSWSSAGSDYTAQLSAVMSDPVIKGFEEAHELLEKRGYLAYHDSMWEDIEEKVDFGKYFPVSTPIQQGSWKKNEKKERYAILINNQLPSKTVNRLNRALTADLNQMEKMLKDIYHLPFSNIKRFHKMIYQDMVDTLARFSGKLLNNPDAELLIFYTGHGHIAGEEHGATKYNEGSKLGLLDEANFSELHLKYLLNEFLNPLLAKEGANPPKILIILDCCYSGAWVAENDKPDKKMDKPI